MKLPKEAVSMPQWTTGVYRLTQIPAFYKAFQNLLGADRSRRQLARDYVRAQPHDRVLDIGCVPDLFFRILAT
jgi:hypothetical protein